MTDQTTRGASPVDGVARSKEAEKALDQTVHSLMTSPAGKDMMAWLRSITTNYVLGPNNDLQAFAYQEGQRWIMAMIQTRIDNHEKRQTTR